MGYIRHIFAVMGIRQAALSVIGYAGTVCVPGHTLYFHCRDTARTVTYGINRRAHVPCVVIGGTAAECLVIGSGPLTGCTYGKRPVILLIEYVHNILRVPSSAGHIGIAYGLFLIFEVTVGQLYVAFCCKFHLGSKIRRRCIGQYRCAQSIFGIGA